MPGEQEARFTVEWLVYVFVTVGAIRRRANDCPPSGLSLFDGKRVQITYRLPTQRLGQARTRRHATFEIAVRQQPMQLTIRCIQDALRVQIRVPAIAQRCLSMTGCAVPCKEDSTCGDGILIVRVGVGSCALRRRDPGEPSAVHGAKRVGTALRRRNVGKKERISGLPSSVAGRGLKSDRVGLSDLHEVRLFRSDIRAQSICREQPDFRIEWRDIRQIRSHMPLREGFCDALPHPPMNSGRSS